jgi:hypothetical protein
VVVVDVVVVVVDEDVGWVVVVVVVVVVRCVVERVEDVVLVFGDELVSRVAMTAAAIPAAIRATRPITAGTRYGERRRARGRGGGGGGGGGRTAVAVSSIGATGAPSAAASAAPSGGRSAGSFARAEFTTPASAGGTSPRKLSTAGAGRSRCMAASSIGCCAVNGSRPVSIRKRITPSEYTSLAGVAGSPAACSGEM